MIASLTEFRGYDEPTNSTFVYIDGKPQSAVTPNPNFLQVATTNNVTLWEGQTAVLSGLIYERSNRVKDKIPVLGDLPLLGRLFRSETTTYQKCNLIIFVTPTLVDPAGNQIQSDAEPHPVRSQIPFQNSN